MQLSHNPWNKVTACMRAPIFPPDQNDTEDGPDDSIWLCTTVDWEHMQSATVVQEKLLA